MTMGQGGGFPPQMFLGAPSIIPTRPTNSTQ
jgi:hypothetical protein